MARAMTPSVKPEMREAAKPELRRPAKPDMRLPALRRFAIAITVLNLIGRTWLGFEGSIAQLVVALGTAYAMEIALELIDAWANRRRARFLGGVGTFVDFMLPAHITGLAVSMLMYANGRLLPFALASAIGTGSKAIFTAPVGPSRRHFLNPSNTGVVVTMLLFPWVEITAPWQFTENLHHAGDWLLPGLIICTGSLLNARFTGRLPLVLSWLGGFAAQAVFRATFLGVAYTHSLLAMTGVAFVLFTFYMAPDPGTTPSSARGQIGFGLSVALAYGILIALHVTYGMFFGLLIVCSIRGIALNVQAFLRARQLELGSLQQTSQ
jgi:hypothetical protein